MNLKLVKLEAIVRLRRRQLTEAQDALFSAKLAEAKAGRGKGLGFPFE